LNSNLHKLKRLDYLVTTFFGAGFFPKAPGTFASILGFTLILFVPYSYKFYVLSIGIILIVLFSPKMIKQVEAENGNDASIIVIDEILGIFIVFLSPIIPITPLSAILGISLFRFFDIYKPGLIRNLNNKKGAKYVLLDDVFAGIFATILLHLFYFLYRIVFLLYFLNKFL